MKIGISHNRLIDTKDYVLSKFSKEDLNILSPILDKVPEIVEDFITNNFDNVMNKYNRKWYNVSFLCVKGRFYGNIF